jgi:phosphate-selective porin OprO and OprP
MRWGVLVFLLWLVAAPGALLADPLAELRQRLAALERENQDLRRTIERQSLPPAASEGHVRSIIEEYLNERNVQLASTETAIYSPPESSGFESPGMVVGQDMAMTASWKNGIELATKDRAYRFHVGGRWQFDSSWYSVDPAVQNNLPGGVQYHDGVDFRRARLRVDGTIYEVIEFDCEYDFVNSSRLRNSADTGAADINVPALTDLWMQFSHTPIGNIRVGNQKEAIGFEHMVSSRFLPFMERSFNQDTFYGGSFNGFTPGAAVFDTIEERVGYNIGIFKPTNNVFGTSVNDGDYAVTGRLAWLPVYEDEGRQLVHLGVSGRQATTYDGRMRFRTRDAMRAGASVQWPLPADISVLGNRMQWINAEFAAVQGPWTLQAEWLTSLTSHAREITTAGIGPEVDSLSYHGGYVQLLYFLTGENDHYNFGRMSLDRVVPYENFFWVPGDGGSCFGTGAWQIGARYNYLDLNDQGINGGELHNLTAGLNWFFNPNTKWQFNYIATFRDASQTVDFADGSGWIHGWGMRFAQDF